MLFLLPAHRPTPPPFHLRIQPPPSQPLEAARMRTLSTPHTTTPLAPSTIPAANPQRNGDREDWAFSCDVGFNQAGPEKPPPPSLPLRRQHLSSRCPPASSVRPRKDQGWVHQREELSKAWGSGDSRRSQKPTHQPPEAAACPGASKRKLRYPDFHLRGGLDPSLHGAPRRAVPRPSLPHPLRCI